MAEKKQVEQITSRDADFAQWYTDIVKKAELVEYSGIKGCMIIRPTGYAIWELIQKNLVIVIIIKLGKILIKTGK